MSVTVTNSKVTTLNTLATVESNAATADVDSTAEVFTITPASKHGLIIVGGTGSTADDAITVSIAAGDMWAAKAISLTLAKDTEKAVIVDTARVIDEDGYIKVTLTPAATDKLLTDHAAYVKYVDMV